MLDVLESVLKTPYGIKLMSPTDLGKVANDTATGHYFPGDRENGGVFKHACMMATAAMFKAAKEVKDEKLAARLSTLAYWIRVNGENAVVEIDGTKIEGNKLPIFTDNAVYEIKVIFK
jgi:hypothetical protein